MAKQLRIDIIVDDNGAIRVLEKVEDGFDKAKKSAKEFGQVSVSTTHGLADIARTSKHTTDGLGLMGTAATRLGGVLAGAFTVQKIVQFADRTLEAADRLDDLRDRFDMGVVSLQSFDTLAQRNGTTLESVARASEQLGVKLASGDKSTLGALDRLGLKFEELRGMKPEDRFTAVMTAIGGIPDVAGRTEAGVAAMGRAFLEVGSLATTGLATARAQIEQSGAVLDEVTVKTLAKAKNFLDEEMALIRRGSASLAADFINYFALPANWLVETLHWDDQISKLHADIAESEKHIAQLASAIRGTREFSSLPDAGNDPITLEQMTPKRRPKFITDPTFDRPSEFLPGFTPGGLEGLGGMAEREATLGRLIEQQTAFTAATAAWNAEMQSGLVIIGEVQAAASGMTTTQTDQVRGLTEDWRMLGAEIKGAYQLMVPKDFSYEQAYADAGFISHGSLAGSGVRNQSYGTTTIHINAQGSIFDTERTVEHFAQRIQQAQGRQHAR